ncbi:MAG: imidazoleglycerol-phosphate dehydratase HisB [Candidatus Omnitrophica bacterium]|nr:imidazoleglycerol-phosphate dehydratase HisB [Candidatus Omnitrophota bacterium]MCM8809717.1 imidazoleglycerol-phosphate dehydratase HisB [Candidatus Omnitrophota bacterium]MCM8810690.1 imidazoleglycerol-phosphate dehydratase HisB [Candidatus Omnitrophota bacterium]MCM8832844.1 imidazoleglycerol-phosphate dehydratase HisB [Candidatus Omnitrophota bacterium]
MKRKGIFKRKTKETDIEIEINLDGQGSYNIDTPIGFFNHMLELFSKFSSFDLKIKAKGDIEVDTHHIVEDIGICLGSAIKEALKDKKGIKRFGFSSTPMDEVLVNISLDISGRGCLVFNVPFIKGREGSFEIEDAKEFLKSFVNHLGITLHINLVYGENLHHILEAIFKGLAIALKDAVKIEGKEIPSTKGKID